MKITKTQLKQIIKEELEEALSESDVPVFWSEGPSASAAIEFLRGRPDVDEETKKKLEDAFLKAAGNSEQSAIKMIKLYSTPGIDPKMLDAFFMQLPQEARTGQRAPA